MGVQAFGLSTLSDAAGATVYHTFGSGHPFSTESDSFSGVPINCTVKNLHVNVADNGPSGNSTLSMRINAGAGNMTMTITGSTTGVFQDTSNTDSVTQGGDFAFHFIEGTTASIKFISLAFEVAA